MSDTVTVSLTRSHLAVTLSSSLSSGLGMLIMAWCMQVLTKQVFKQGGADMIKIGDENDKSSSFFHQVLGLMCCCWVSGDRIPPGLQLLHHLKASKPALLARNLRQGISPPPPPPPLLQRRHPVQVHLRSIISHPSSVLSLSSSSSSSSSSSLLCFAPADLNPTPGDAAQLHGQPLGARGSAVGHGRRQGTT
eukprot:1215348-Rhodomonas_salina.4